MLEIMKYAKGNPGALTFLMELMKPEHMTTALVVMNKLDQIESLRGTNLYVLWSDLCTKDMIKVAKLCEHCPNDVLEDACSRQDYSGRALVAQYLT